MGLRNFRFLIALPPVSESSTRYSSKLDPWLMTTPCLSHLPLFSLPAPCKMSTFVPGRMTESSFACLSQLDFWFWRSLSL